MSEDRGFRLRILDFGMRKSEKREGESWNVRAWSIAHGVEGRKQKLRRWEGEMRRGLSLHKLKIWNYSTLDFRYKASLSTFQTARYALCPLLYALFAHNS